MIRDFKNQDTDCIMKLWLQTNKTAHPFINPIYWQNNFEAVKESIGDATLYLYEVNMEVKGFIGLIDGHIAGIFVSQDVQSTGIGKKLLDYVKKRNAHLSLSVYKKNKKAIEFYLREKFIISSEQLDKHTEELELCMEWMQKV